METKIEWHGPVHLLGSRRAIGEKGMKHRVACVALALALWAGLPAQAQQSGMQEGPRAAPTVRIESGILPVLDATPNLDVAAATSGYLDRVSGDARARSDAYANGNGWLALVNLLYGLGLAAALMLFGLSAWLRDWAEERTRSRSYQVMIYAAILVTLAAAAALPLALYEGYFREHGYGHSNQSLLAWLGDFSLVYVLALSASVIGLPLLYAVIRRARDSWWLWGGGLAILLLVALMTIWPVFIAPLFNDHAPLAEGPLKTRIVALADANGIAADDIRVADVSQRSNRLSANVSGFLGTGRITLSDNLLKNGSEDEVLAVLGHEIGHQVMGHAMRNLLLQGLLILLGFGFSAWGFGVAADLFGGMWQVRKVEDVAGLPALASLLALFFVLMLPVSNAISRTAEQQADLYGLNAARKTDAFATLLLKQAPVRKLDPGEMEEALLFGHPSARSRIEAAMRWKKAHMHDADVRAVEGPGISGR
jgi:STE24 endopeptidase